MFTALDGYKTYALVGLYLLTVGYQIVTGQAPMDVATMQEAILALGVGAARSALTKLEPAK